MNRKTQKAVTAALAIIMVGSMLLSFLAMIVGG